MGEALQERVQEQNKEQERVPGVEGTLLRTLRGERPEIGETEEENQEEHSFA